MQRLIEIIEKYPGKWESYKEYITRIDGMRNTDFSMCIENCKALLEGIARNVCDLKSTAFAKNDGVGKLIKLAFESLGYASNDEIRSIVSSFNNIATRISDIRNHIGATAHGKSAEQLSKRNEIYNAATQDFLILSTEMVACFLVQSFEAEEIKVEVAEPTPIYYDDNEDFNRALDETYGDFVMKDYSFYASQILFSLDLLAYTTELETYKLALNETDNGE